MLKPVAFAHAVTIVTAVFYLLCALLVYSAPDLIFGITQSWFHGLNIEAARTAFPLSIERILWGLITISVVTWVTTYATIVLYNRLAKQKG
ncbi:MAG: hypothetical protein A2958_02390 [Candidatus Levybacteria bacterium RIFCSPLOWO2_01_FULL_38_13]|nr:MAG: hypothetical protein A2629_04020 [Candidatus Levybacteria bacterium RIFCSPHIGHO2_01_FULL_41_15]OGH35098.1 MAG: hypothetical protein A2958_02390 [Candidatus Levybacteria bacterium RIFCSPLOWO2_01_FULL_38_13]